MPAAKERSRIGQVQRVPWADANVVRVPTFNDPRDRQALGTLAEVFSGRQVVGPMPGT
jgi:hypothetical protein